MADPESFAHSELALSKKKLNETKCEWAVQVAQHLLSPLAIGSKYTLDNHYRKENLPQEKGDYLCPCEKTDKLTGSFGDNSFGCVDAWHGSIDIWMEDVVVNVSKEDVGDNTENTRDGFSSDSEISNNESSVEVKQSNKFSVEDYKQMISQTIVFSFWQQKQNEHFKIDNSLIPSLGICRNKVIVHFYDCKNDVLLQSAPLFLFTSDEDLNLDMNTIVFLWLTLNHNYFASGITDEMKVYKANFFERVGDCIGKYKNEITRGIHSISHSEKEPQIAWANKSGRISKNSVTIKLALVKKVEKM